MSYSLKDRDQAFDSFRGIAIIAVVAIHAIPWQLYLEGIGLSYRQILNFAVPAFLFISGFWMSKKPISSLGDYGVFLRKRFLRILIPYLLWSLVYIGYDAIKAHDINFTQVVYKLLIGGASVHFYFIIVISQLYILTPLLQGLNYRPYGFVSVSILNFVALCVLYILRCRNILSYNSTYYLIHDPFFYWVIFYQIGLFAGDRDGKFLIPGNMYRAVLLAVLASLAFSVWEAMFLLSRYDNWLMAICALKYSSVIYSICVIIGFLVLRQYINTWPRFLVTLGEYSFGIYLIHMIILRGIIKVLHDAHTLNSFQPVYEFIMVSMTLLGSCAVIAISRKIFPRLVCDKMLGF